jgi:hypothetical protein
VHRCHAKITNLFLHEILLISSFSMHDDRLLRLNSSTQNLHTGCLWAKDPWMYTKPHQLLGHAQNAFLTFHFTLLISSFSLLGWSTPNSNSSTQTLEMVAYELLGREIMYGIINLGIWCYTLHYIFLLSCSHVNTTHLLYHIHFGCHMRGIREVIVYIDYPD